MMTMKMMINTQSPGVFCTSVVHSESSNYSFGYDDDDDSDDDNDDDDDYKEAWCFVRSGCSPRELRSRRFGPRPSHAPLPP